MWFEASFEMTPEKGAAIFGGEFNARAFRKCIAHMDTLFGLGIPSSIFGYDDEGTSLPGFNPYTLTATGNGLVMRAVGDEESTAMRKAAASVHSSLIRHSQSFIPMHERSGQLEARFVPMQKGYFLPSMMVGKRKKDNFWMKAADDVTDGASWIDISGDRLRLAIARGFLMQAEHLVMQDVDVKGDVLTWVGQQMMANTCEPERVAAFADRLGIQIEKIDGHVFVSHLAQTSVLLQGVEISMKVVLGGPWATGRARNEGNGLAIAGNVRSFPLGELYDRLELSEQI